jgi:hypothetical protein
MAELSLARLVLDAVEPKCPEQRVDLVPLWAEVRDELVLKDTYKLNVSSGAKRTVPGFTRKRCESGPIKAL